MNKFTRNCPNCKKELTYSRSDVKNLAEKNGVLCRSCGQYKRIYLPEFGTKMATIYKNSSAEMKIRRMGMLNKRHKETTKNKMSLSAKKNVLNGTHNFMFFDCKKQKVQVWN